MNTANQQISESANQRISGSVRSPVVTRHSSLVNRLAPWAAFAALLVWGWRGQNLFHDIPTYGDVLELMWGISWYGDALRTGVDPAVYPLAFYPGGWQLATFGQSVGPALFLAMLPLHWIAGAAFAYQIAVLLTFVLAFGGTLALAGRFMGRLGATVVALLYTFWGFRWFQTLGHLNFLLGSACLPWMVWALERFLQKSSLRPLSPRGEGRVGATAHPILSGSFSSGLRGPRPSPARCTSSGSAASCWPAGCSGGGWENRSTGERL